MLFCSYLLRPKSLLTSPGVFLAGDDVVASPVSLSKPRAFAVLKPACVIYSLNVIDTFSLSRQPSPAVADMEISGKENTNVN